jgi:hypothetical protein
MSLLFWPKRKPIATFDTSKYDVSSPGMGVIIAKLKNPIKRSQSKMSSTSSSSGRDTGEGRAMSEAARTKFIKDKNPSYNVKKTPQGATYGVRKIV